MILFIRHLESNKNINRNFSSDKDDECLTDSGKAYGIELSKNIKLFIEKHNFNVKNVYCANSTRAISTAEFIANQLGVGVKTYDDLRSNNSGELRGKSEDEAKVINPTFIDQLKLFRVGIFSSYNFIKLYNREDKHEFEIRVNNCIDKILSDNEEDLSIIILHHSSITAAIIRYARMFYSYPSDFYGHIVCDLGKLYLINSSEIILCNETSDKLLNIRLV